MSGKIQPCSVSLQPLENMENIKKKSGKDSHQSTPEVVQSPEVETKPSESKGESSQAKVAVNGKSNKKKEKGNKKSVSNGVSDVALNSNGTHTDGSPLIVDESNPELIEEESLVHNSEPDNDELFPELIYDENSDECNFDSSSPDFSPVGRSVTRRSQAKIIPTPETPQNFSKADTGTEASSSPAESLDRPSSQDTMLSDNAMPLKEKVLKMREIYSLTPSKGSPVSEALNEQSNNTEPAKINTEVSEVKTTVEVAPKADTNSVKSQAKISPFRRSARISDQYSTMANYSGNNTTQETDVVSDINSSTQTLDGTEETSEANCSQESCEDGSSKSYSDSYRSIKGRKSYKPLREISLRNLAAQRNRSKLGSSKTEEVTISSVNATIGSETRDTILSENSSRWTPVGHVVGCKRRQSPDSHVESPALVLSEGRSEIKESVFERPSKRQRLLGYVATPLRNLRDKMINSSTPITKHTQIPNITNHKEGLPLSSNETASCSKVPLDQQMPNVADIVHVKGNEEHKWCSIM